MNSLNEILKKFNFLYAHPTQTKNESVPIKFVSPGSATPESSSLVSEIQLLQGGGIKGEWRGGRIHLAAEIYILRSYIFSFKYVK